MKKDSPQPAAAPETFFVTADHASRTVHVENKSRNARPFGSFLIEAQSTRTFRFEDLTPAMIPRAQKVEETKVEETDPVAAAVAELQTLNAKDLILRINAAKGTEGAIGDAELELLGDAEQQREKPRATVLEAIATELLQRAAAASEGGSGTGGDDTGQQ